MANIRVDCGELRTIAGKIDAYVEFAKDQQKKANEEQERLSLHWQGLDHKAYEEKWNTATVESMKYNGMLKAMENYADYLRYAASEYEKAQERAIGTATRLRWL